MYASWSRRLLFLSLHAAKIGCGGGVGLAWMDGSPGFVLRGAVAMIGWGKRHGTEGENLFSISMLSFRALLRASSASPCS